MSDIKSLEHCTLKVPYEVLNKKFRNAQKVIDREVSHIAASASELTSLSSREGVKVEEAEAALSSMVFKLQALKRKAEEALTSQGDAARNCKTRVEHLKDHANHNKSANMVWKRTRLDRMLVDYFLRSGFYDAATMMAEKTGIKGYVDIDLFLHVRQVEDALRQHNPGPVLAWCHENKSKLRKNKSTLELNVRIQEFVELIKQNKRREAVLFARRHFSAAGNDNHVIPSIQKTMALLAFNPANVCERYKELFDDKRWDDLVEQFRVENFVLHQLNRQSMLEITLQCGLASLKTPHCYQGDEQSRDCPVCCRLFNELARNLPYAHCAQSRLICHISGEPVNEHNPPMMLPSGYVYGENSLRSIAGQDESSMVMCSRTKEKFKLDEAQKVFIM